MKIVSVAKLVYTQRSSDLFCAAQSSSRKKKKKNERRRGWFTRLLSLRQLTLPRLMTYASGAARTARRGSSKYCHS